jgi:hypothetical protein
MAWQRILPAVTEKGLMSAVYPVHCMLWNDSEENGIFKRNGCEEDEGTDCGD